LADVQRLVLLGDLLELRHGPLAAALNVARPVLRDIATALPESAEVVIVPGNHDHHLLRAWSERRARDGAPAGLGLEAALNWTAGDPLASIVEWLSPHPVRVAYPGVWLREDVYAIHGHYGDLHSTVPMLERLGAGFMRRVVAQPPSGPRRPEDYEAVLAPLYAWIDAVAQFGGVQLRAGSRDLSTRAWSALTAADGRRSWRRRGLALAFPALVALLSRAGMGPLRADLSDAELGRAGVRAMKEVIARLEVRASYVIFGHTHRAGPLPGDDPAAWRCPGGCALLNSGSWVHERAFLGARPATSPYRAGFAATVDPDRQPVLGNLLD
jgi:predicted phosphodiesterase